MNIEIVRFHRRETCTIGVVSINEEPIGFSLEDAVRAEKIPGETAIPPGMYEILPRTEGGMVQRYRAKFGSEHYMLELQDVPNYKYVYFHIGNTPRDTEGCILIANTYDFRNPDVIGVSTDLYRRFWDRVSDALEREQEVWVDIQG